MSLSKINGYDTFTLFHQGPVDQYYLAYVDVPSDHPIYGRFYEDIKVPQLPYKVTYSRLLSPNGPWRIGFDTAQRSNLFLTENDVKIALNTLVDWLASLN